MAADVDEIEDVADALDTDPEHVEQALDSVEETLRQLADVDIDVDDPGDLDTARQALPTDPIEAELTAAALRGTPLGRVLEYVHPSDRQDGYWRRSRERSDLDALSDAELRQRHAFVQASMDARGLEGTVETDDGREIPKGAERRAEELDGESFESDDEDTDEDRGRSILGRLLGR